MTSRKLTERLAEDPRRFAVMPAPVPLDEVVETTETEPAGDPDGGRNADNDWLIRYGAG